MGIHSSHLAATSLVLLLAGLVSCSVVGWRASTTKDDQNTVFRESMSVLGMRIHGADFETDPPFMRLGVRGRNNIGVATDQLTLNFELRSPSYPNLALHVIHCDRFWVPTQNVFVQDPARLTTYDFDIKRAAIGVRQYDYECSISFPRIGSRIRIEHSGNYLAQVVDYDRPSYVLGEARFFVIEANSAVVMSITSDFFESSQTTTPQHGVRVFVETQPSFEIFGSQIESIALIENGKWDSPTLASSHSAVVSGENGVPWVRWFPSFSGKIRAEFRNIPAGNEHRILDLSDVILYPPISTPVSTPLSDVPRRGFSQFDNNGIAISKILPSGSEDYVLFEFRLDILGKEVQEDIFVIGSFTDWVARKEWEMRFDTTSQLYIAYGLMRRAVQEYEYVAGHWDDSKSRLVSGDATLLEGNVKQTNTIFHALVYYRETSTGGYDRIVGLGTSTTGTE